MAELVKWTDVALEVRTLGGSMKVLESCSFELDASERVAIVGKSGAGKTSLLSVLGFLEPPSSGQILWEGRDVSRMSRTVAARLRGSKIGFVFQAFHLLEPATVIDNVCLSLRYAGFERSQRKAIAEEALDRVGLLDRADELACALSGGERQRVAIARAIAPRPLLLLADEPTGNLDGQTTSIVMDVLKEVSGDGALVVVTHDAELARQLDRTIELTDGKITDAAEKRPA